MPWTRECLTRSLQELKSAVQGRCTETWTYHGAHGVSFYVLVARLCATLINPCKYVPARPKDNSADTWCTLSIPLTLTWPIRSSRFQMPVALISGTGRQQLCSNYIIFTFIHLRGCSIKYCTSKTLRLTKSNLFWKHRFSSWCTLYSQRRLHVYDSARAVCDLLKPWLAFDVQQAASIHKLVHSYAAIKINVFRAKGFANSFLAFPYSSSACYRESAVYTANSRRE